MWRQACSAQGFDHTEEAAVGSDKDGARPSLRQRVDLSNQSRRFLVEDALAFFLGNIERMPADISL